MFKEIQKDNTLVRILIILLIVTLLTYLFNVFWQFINVFSDIIGIVVISWLVSFVLEPIVDKISSITNLSKKVATAITYVLLFAAIIVIGVIFVPLINSQIQTLSKSLPLFLASSPKFISRWSDSLVTALANSVILIPSVAQYLLYVIFVLVISFYFIIDKDHLNRELYALTPMAWHNRMKFVQKVVATTFASFLHIQLLIGLFTGIATWVVLQAVGIQFALAIALLAGVLGALPMIGPILATIPPVFFAFIIDPWLAVIVLLVLIIIQQIIFNIFVPRAFGKAFKMHPIIIILASIAGFKLGGIMGTMFAIPVVGISSVVVKEIWQYFIENNE
jgi:predicted PurR-regulated permease PerM